MVLEQGSRFDLLSNHNVARYCSQRRMGDDGLPLEAAFFLRDNEDYLSTNWLEHFDPSDRAPQLAGVRQSLIDKGRTVSRNAFFAVLNVGVSVAYCKGKLGLDIRFTVLGETHDPSHAGIFGTRLSTEKECADAAGALAKCVAQHEVYPAV